MTTPQPKQPTTEHSLSELPQLHPQKSQLTQARTYINKQTTNTITKQYLNKRIHEVATEYSTATNLHRNGLKNRSRDSMDKGLLTATAKKIEFRRAVYRDDPALQRNSNSNKHTNNNLQALARLSLPRASRPPRLSKQPSTKIKSQSQILLQPSKLSHDTFMNQFLFTVNLSNSLSISNRQQCTYKAFIDKGNNGLLLKSIVKRRWWWHLVEEQESCNLLWTEWTNKEFVERMVVNEAVDRPLRTEESVKQLGSLKSTVKAVENITQKQARIGRVINLGKFEKLSMKVASDPDSYFIFSKRLVGGCPPDLLTSLHYTDLKSPRLLDSKDQQSARIHNHLQGGLNLHSKKLLLSNLKKFYQNQNKQPFENLPLTFHIKQGTNDEEFVRLLEYFDEVERRAMVEREERESKEEGKKGKKRVMNIGVRNIWICKPGENSNRGNGICVVNKRQQLIQLAKSLQTSTYKRSIIIQKYIQNPFLIQKRKFDIRCYLLITTYNSLTKGYWYDQGYIRTASQEFSLDDVDNKLIHLTNDAIQKKGKQYGKFENANKMSFEEFQQYLEEKSKHPRVRFARACEEMKGMARDMVEAVQARVNTKRREFAFELFGLDFMLDTQLKPWLIEANSNPCLDTTGPLLGRLIPELIENVFKLAIDPIFPPPSFLPKTKVKAKQDYFEKNRFILIYDSQQPTTNNKPKSRQTEEKAMN